MRSIPGFLVALILALPAACGAAFEETPQVRRESRLAIHLVRRYCRPDYLIKLANLSDSPSQWTWASTLLADGRYKVTVATMTWDVDVATKTVEPGAAVRAAVGRNRLPEACLCVEGTPPPPEGWQPAPDKSDVKPVRPAAKAEPAAPQVEPAVPRTERAAPRTERAAVDGGSPKRTVSEDRPRVPQHSASAGSSLPGWLVGTWQGPSKGATVRFRFSSDGTWRRQLLEPGAGGEKPAVLTVKGTWVAAGTAWRLTVTSVDSKAGAHPSERAPKVGSSVDAYCYRSGDDGLIMLTSGATFRATRLRD